VCVYVCVCACVCARVSVRVCVCLLAGLIPYELSMTDCVLVLFHLQVNNVLIMRKQLLCYVVCKSVVDQF